MSDRHDPLSVRCVRIHYLGYSGNYDEWLNVDTDSHRMAQRGTFTVGADLRAVRKNTPNFGPGIRRMLIQASAHNFSDDNGYDS